MSELEKWRSVKREAEQALKRNLQEHERRKELARLKDAILHIRLLARKAPSGGGDQKLP
jgi:hypothetical protein